MTASPGRTPLGLEPLARYGRLAAILLVIGSLATLPAALLLEPQPGAEIFLLTALGVMSGVVCWFLPWERMPDWSLDLLTVLGTLEVLTVSVALDETYRLLYFEVAAFAALALPTRRRVALQVALILLALLVPVLYHDDAREQVRIALLFTPVIMIVTGAVRYLVETLERRERASREFAEEAITLALRLRRGTPGREDERRRELADMERALQKLREPPTA